MEARASRCSDEPDLGDTLIPEVRGLGQPIKPHLAWLRMRAALGETRVPFPETGVDTGPEDVTQTPNPLCCFLTLFSPTQPHLAPPRASRLYLSTYFSRVRLAKGPEQL